MQSLIDGDKELSEVPSSQQRPMPKTLEYYSNTRDSRNDAIVIAYAGGGYTLKEIGAYFGIHYTTVSGVVKNHKSKTCRLTGLMINLVDFLNFNRLFLKQLP
jgi:putative transposase